MEPFTHVYSVPGKEIRSQMIDAFNLWLKVPQDKLKVISKVVSMLHTASLLYVVGEFSHETRDDMGTV